MSQNQKLSLIQPLVEHLLQQQDPADWQRALTEQGIMTADEAASLDNNALAAAYKTLKTMQLLNQHPDQIMNAIEEHEVCWKVELAYDYQHGVISY